MKTNLTSNFALQNRVRCIFFISFVLLACITVMGQVVTGRLHVRVLDANGGLVSGAAVIVTNEVTGQSVTQSTSAKGEALFINLEPGRYALRVEQMGFAAKVAENIQIAIGESRDVEIQLGPDSISSAVNVVSVEGERPEQLSAIPNLNNDLTPLLQIVPGAIPTGSSALGKIVIDGKGKDQQHIRLDGVDATQLVDMPAGDPALDVISSFQKPEVAFDINNSQSKSRAFATIFGPGTGTVVQGVSYSANNVWRGQLYGENRNEAFNARNFFDREGKNGIRRTRFGGKFGGRLIQDKAFLYFAYDGVRGRTEQSMYEAVPVDAVCHCGGGPLASMVDGFLPPGTVVIGPSLNPDFLVAKRRVQATVDANAWDARIDTIPSATQSIIFRMTRQEANNLVPDGITARQQRQHIVFNNLLIGTKLVHNSNWLNDIKFGVNQTRVDVDLETAAFTSASLSRSLITLGGTVNVDGLPDARPTIPIATLGGLSKGIGRGFSLTPTSFNPSYDLNGNLSSTYELFFGVEARFIRLTADRLGGLSYAFPTLASLRTGSPDSVTFLSDLSALTPFTSKTGPRHGKQTYFMGYVQIASQWSLRFKATYGVRYDYFGPVRERDNRAVVVDPETGSILPAGSSFYRTEKFNFEPRFGFEYRLAEAGFFRDVVLRGGAGVYSGVPKIGDLLIPIDSDRFSTGMNGGVFPLEQAVVISNFLNNPRTRQFQPLAFARDFTTSERAYKWEGSVTKTLKEIYDLKLLYTGNVGRNLPLAGVANQIIAVETNPDPTKPAIVIREFDIVEGNQVFKPYGEFHFRSSRGRSSYEAMTIQLSRNSTKSTTLLPQWMNLADFNAQYTLSRNVGNVSGAVVSNPLDFSSDHGYNAADARHTFGLSTVVNLWEALDRPRSDLLTGWRIVPSISARSGLPLTVRLERPDVVYIDGAGKVYSSPAVGRRALLNTPGGGASGSTRVPDLVPGVNPYLRQGLELLNPAAFTIPAPGSFGNLRRGQLRGPGSFQVDLGVMRNLFSKERVAAELKLEIFNLFNDANFNNPTVALPNALGTSSVDNQIQPGVPFARPSAGAFGIIIAADPGRQFQLSFTLRFNQGFTN
jgi:hypothetical protein